MKPSNVLIAVDRSAGGWDERAVLTDFGIAQFEGDPRLTQTGMVMGSPGFTAPERIRGGDATPASDLWSLGATIYAAVEGSGPYEQRGGAITTMSAIINEDAPVAPSAARLAPLIAALLRREPSARPSAAVAARMFTEVLPLLSDGPAHPATLRSAYVPSPAAPVASVGAPPAAAGLGAVGAQAAAAGLGAADCPEPADASAASAVEAAEAPAVAAAHADDAAPAAEQSGAALAGVGAAAPGAGAAAEEVKAADEAAPNGAAPAEVAASAGSSVATSLDATPDDLVPSRSDVTWIDSGADDASSPADTVIPARNPEGLTADPGVTVAGPGKTELSLPAASKAPSAAPQAKPTFTASKRTEQAGPSFSPSRPAPPVPSQPDSPYSSPRSGWRADPPTMPEPAYEPPQYGGPNAQYGSYQGSNAQYSGPAQPHPDLARQYAPGTGGRTQRRSRRGRTIALIIAALVVAAAIGGGAAYLTASPHRLRLRRRSSTTSNVSLANQPGSIQALDTPSSAVPTGWTPEKVQPAGATAGFSIDIPPGWGEQQKGLVTSFTTADGVYRMDIDLTPHTYTDMVTEAKAVESNDIAIGKFPGYKRAALHASPVRGTTGAFWQFTWIRGGVKTRSDDIFFILPTSAGSQSYAIYFRAPNSGWNSTNLPLFKKMLHTFQTVSA